MALTRSQQKATELLISFLLSQEEELILSGGAGTGKSYITSWFLKEGYSLYREACCKQGLPILFTQEPVVTATTNKAAAVLGQQLHTGINTIHSYLGLKVTENYETGVTTLKPTNVSIEKYNEIVFIDECSMINKELYTYIKKYLKGCKIIYVGDMYQLAPVKETISPIYEQGIQVIELTDNVRLKNHKELLNLSSQLKTTVQNSIFKPIQIDNKIIHHVSGNQLKSLIDRNFLYPNSENKIVTYTNKRCTSFNDYIKYELRHYTDSYVKGEIYIAGSALVENCGNKKRTVLGTDCEVIINDISDAGVFRDSKIPIDLVYIKATKVQTYEQVALFAPKDNNQLLQALKEEARLKNWPTYFKIKECIADLRLADSSTIHKAQGSTYKNIYIDLSDLSTCRDPKTAARLLYVACTRATDNVYLYGKLDDRYGGLNEQVLSTNS